MRCTFSHWCSILCLLGLIASLLSCDNAPPPPIDLATPTATRLLPSLSAVPTGEPTLACTTPSLVGKLNLMPLPGNVRGPLSLALFKGRLYVAGKLSNNLGVVENDQLTRVVPVGAGPIALFADEALGKLFVLNAKELTVSATDGQQVQTTLSIRNPASDYQEVFAMVGDAQNHRLFVSKSGPREIVVIDSQAFTVSARLPLGNPASAQVLVDGDNRRLLLRGDDTLNVFDLQSLVLIDTLKLPKGTYQILLHDPKMQRLYAAYYDEQARDGVVAVVENGRQVGTLPGGPAPLATVNDRLYAARSISNTVSVLDPQTFQTLTSIDVDLAPDELALLADPTGERLYITMGGQYWPEYSTLAIVDLKRNVLAARIALTAQPRQLIADATRKRLYALMPAASAVLISDGQRVLSQVPLERAPFQMALDEAAGKLYITEFSGNSVNVVDVATHNVERKFINGSGVLAVDKAHNRLLVSNRSYALGTLTPMEAFTVTTFTPPPGIIYVRPPTALLVNPSLPRLYAVAWNGILGGNDEDILYVLDSDTLQRLGPTGGAVSALALDAEAQQLYEAVADSIGGTTQLWVLDALNLKQMSSSGYLPARVHAMLVNPTTHHLFLGYGRAYRPSAAENTVEVLDTRTLGHVASFALSDEPVTMARLGDRVYIASNSDTNLAVVRDCATAVPLPPTATPTWTPTPTLIPAPTSTPRPTATATRVAATNTPTVLPPSTPSSSSYVRRLIAVPGNPSQLYALTTDFRLVRSSDGGMSWRGISATSTGADVLSGIGIDYRNPKTVYLTTDKGIFRSNDEGQTWTKVSGLFGQDVTVSFDDPRVLWTVSASGSRYFIFNHRVVSL